MAFDSIPREEVWRCVEERYGVKGKPQRAVKSLYQFCVCNVRTTQGSQKWFPVVMCEQGYNKRVDECAGRVCVCE